MIRAIAAKDLRASAASVAIASLFAVAIAVLILFTSLQSEAPSPIDSVRTSVRFLAPILAWLAARRLFVLEQEEKTLELLRGLPLAPGWIALVKVALGLTATSVACLGILFATAVLVSRVEHLGPELLATASAQLLAYAAFWWGLAALAAQLGRLRPSALVILAVWALAAAEDHVPPELAPFGGVLATSFHGARLSLPWAELGAALGAGLAASACAIALFSWRGGDLARELHARPPASANLIVFLAATALLSYLESGDVSPGRKTAESDGLTPAGRVVLVADRPGGALHRLGVALDEELAALARELGLEDPEALVLVPAIGRTRTRVTSEPGFDLPALRVSLATATEEDVLEQLVASALSLRAFDDADPEHRFFTRGLAAFRLERRRGPSPLRARRAAYAALRLMEGDVPPLARFDLLERSAGEELADVLAWQAVEVLAERCGEHAIPELARAHAGVARSRRALGRALERALFSRAGRSVCVADAAGLQAAWVDRLRAISAEGTRPVAPWAAQLGLVARTRHRDAFDLQLSEVLWATPADTPPELWWRRVDPLLAPAAPAGPLNTYPLAEGETIVTLPLDPRERARATVAAWSPELALWIPAPWIEVGNP